MGKDSPISRERSRSVKRHAVLAEARRHRVVSRAQLAGFTGLSPTTVTHLVRELIGEGYFRELGSGESRGGRPMSMLEFNPQADLVVIVDLHPGRIEATLVDWDGSAAADAVHLPLGNLVADIDAAAKKFTSEHDGRVRAISVAIPGVASGASGQVSLAPAIGLIEGQPLGKLLREATGLPVVVDNDVNLIMVGEHAAGAAKDVDDIVLVHVGDGGIGAALMIDGRLRRGAAGVAGEIGFLPLGAAQPPRDGIGAFEAQWSVRGISAMATPPLGAEPGRTVIAELEARAGADPDARELLETVLVAWAWAVISAVCVLDPSRVLLSGEAADISEPSLRRLRQEVARYAPGPTVIERASLGKAALMHGAARLAFEAYEDVNAPQ